MTIPPETSSRLPSALYAVVMIAIIIGLDIAFFRNRFWERLIANIGIVLVFAAFYLRFLKHP
jgi:type IV secretory pathway VirB2 component (pilin)